MNRSCLLCAAAVACSLLVFLVGCNPFNPAYDDLQCGPAGACPGGMVCSQGVCVSEDAEVCGDGLIVGREVCDDGNLADGDGCSASCSAATCYVPVTHPTVMSGLADQACPTLYLHTGSYAERVTFSRQVTVVGVGSMPPILDGEAAGTVVTVDLNVRVTLRRLVISNGRADAGGGVINRGMLVLDTVTVSDNTAADETPMGGGIENVAGALTLTASIVTKNHLVVTAQAGAPPILSGAGIHSSGGTIRVDGASAIEANDIITVGIAGVTGQGAGINASNTAITIAGASAVRNNVIDLDGRPGAASASGGGLFLTGGTLTVNGGSAIDGNSILAKGTVSTFSTGAFVSGGGFSTDGTAVVLDTAFIRENRAVARGELSTFATAGGGAMRSGSLEIDTTAITGNLARADGLGGGSAGQSFTSASVGGLDLDSLSATITDSSISANHAEVTSESTDQFASVSASVGGLHVGTFGSTPRTVTLLRSTIDGNKATATKGSASIGGLEAELGTGTAVVLNIHLTASTVSNNLAQSPTSASIGGIGASAGTGDTTVNLNIVNSTISGNRADAAMGTASSGGIQARTSTGSAKVNVNLASATVTNNSATGVTTSAGGINLSKGISMANTTCSSRNSIVAGNTATTNADCTASGVVIASSGYNLYGTPGSCTFSGTITGDRTGAAGLGPLANNGGTTLTHALLAGSQAINNANPSGCFDLGGGGTLTTDQRGLPRAAAGRCDIGAFEAQ